MFSCIKDAWIGFYDPKNFSNISNFTFLVYTKKILGY